MSKKTLIRSTIKYFELVDKFLEDGREDKAIYYLRRIVDNDDSPHKVKALVRLAHRYLMLDDVDMADKALLHILTFYPRTPEAYDMMMGNAFIKGDIQLFNHYLQEKRKEFGIAQDTELEDFDNEMPDIILPQTTDIVQTIFGKNMSGHMRFSTKQSRTATSIGQALTYLRQGDFEKCLNQLDLVEDKIASDYMQWVFLITKARCCYQMGKTQDVPDMLNRAYKINPNNMLVMGYMLLYTDKKYDEKFVSRFFEIASNNEFVEKDIVVELVRMFCDMRKSELGLTLVNICLRREPYNRLYLRQKGVILYNIGDNVNAIKTFDLINYLYGDYTDIKFYLKVAKSLDQKIKVEMSEFNIAGLDEYYKDMLSKLKSLDDILDEKKNLNSDFVYCVEWLFNSCNFDQSVADKLVEIGSWKLKNFCRLLFEKMVLGDGYLARIKQELAYILINFYTMRSIRYVESGKFHNVLMVYPKSWEYMDEMCKSAYSRAVSYAIISCGVQDVQNLSNVCQKIIDKMVQNSVIIESSNMLARLILESAQNDEIHIDKDLSFLQVDMQAYNAFVQSLMI